ncbi:hypothetical protein Tcan_07512 [Toxocara canis]|uniref:Uncharacterized protein n=1 Tax=Toxocara canis TaxID=6265 RepID=A0A0B2UU36_TOXCA|nr:hypothetical protein Tcan_07512 [Toxocara canis]
MRYLFYGVILAVIDATCEASSNNQSILIPRSLRRKLCDRDRHLSLCSMEPPISTNVTSKIQYDQNNRFHEWDVCDSGWDLPLCRLLKISRSRLADVTKSTTIIDADAVSSIVEGSGVDEAFRGLSPRENSVDDTAVVNTA